MSGDGETANSGGNEDESESLTPMSTCARCGSRLDRETRWLDGEYDLVCRKCYLLTAS
jgi:hypothetical protein